MQVEEDEVNIVFCVDISGSMCTSVEVQGRHAIRNSQFSRLNREFNAERSRQYLPGQSQNVTYISRLQSMQAAVDAQLQQMRERNPRRHVGIVTFNNEVHVVGDGTQPEVHIAGDRLSDQAAIAAQVREHTNLMTQPIATTATVCCSYLYNWLCH